MQNVVFISSFVPGLDYYAQTERKNLLRAQLLTLGLEFYGVSINSQDYFMVVTKKLKPMKKLAKEFKQDKIYISDSRRSLFSVSIGDFSPTKLGTLKRSVLTNAAGTNTTGGFCLIVSEDNQTYHYVVEHENIT